MQGGSEGGGLVKAYFAAKIIKKALNTIKSVSAKKDKKRSAKKASSSAKAKKKKGAKARR